MPMPVACLCPTADRRPLIQLAINCFLNQDYPHKHLYVLDDGEDQLADLFPPHPLITYYGLRPSARSLGQKLNFLVHMAEEPVCTNWDDDDWSAPDRLRDLLQHLETSSKPVTGYNTIYYWDETRNLAHEYRWARPSAYALGTSQTYLTSHARRHPFRNITRGVDTAFSQQAAELHLLTSRPAGQRMVARYTRFSRWRDPYIIQSYPVVSTTALPKQFFEDLRTANQV